MKPPAGMSKEARKAWKRFVGLLKKTATPIDAPALQLLSERWAEWKEADEKVKADGLVIKQPNGWPGHNPYLAIRQKADAAITRLLREFGLTPASRAKLRAEVEEPAADLDF